METNVNKEYPKVLIERFAETHCGKTPQEIIAEHKANEQKVDRMVKWEVATIFITTLLFLGGILIGGLFFDRESRFPIGSTVVGIIAGLIGYFLIHLPVRRRRMRLPYGCGGQPVWLVEAEQYLYNIEWVMEDLRLLAQKMGKDTLSFTFGDFRHGAEARMGVRSLVRKNAEYAYKQAPNGVGPEEETWLARELEKERQEVLNAFAVYHALYLIEGRPIKWLR